MPHREKPSEDNSISHQIPRASASPEELGKAVELRALSLFARAPRGESRTHYPNHALRAVRLALNHSCL
jgi:hypothetical protein